LSENEFINKWTKILSAEGIKQFPSEFVETMKYSVLEFPSKTLIPGKEFFGTYEVLTTSGESVYQARDLNEAKFIIYAGRSRTGTINLPDSKEGIDSAIKNYEIYIDSLLSRVEKDYKKEFTNNKNFPSVSNEIFKVLNLIRY
jgi:hypothetical protein